MSANGTSVGSLRRTDSVAIEGIADIRRSLAARRSDANDPKATLRRQKLPSNFHLPSPSQIGGTVLSRNLWPKIGRSIRRLKKFKALTAALVPREGAHKR